MERSEDYLQWVGPDPRAEGSPIGPIYNGDMHRYTGERLRVGSRIAVISNDALGNFAAVTPLLQMLRSTHRPSVLDYFGGSRIHELASASDLMDGVFPLHGASPEESVRWLSAGPYDLVVNVEQTAWSKAYAALLAGSSGAVCGPCVGPGGRGELEFPDDEVGRLWLDKRWIAEDLRAKHPILESGFIGEIFCRGCYLRGPIPGYRIPSAPCNRSVPDVLLATAASLPEKLWPIDRWIAAVEALHEQGLSLGLIGAKPSDQGKFWKGAEDENRLIATGWVQDLRGAFTLPEVVGALAKALVVLTLDNGILHFAVASGTPTVGLFRYGIHRLWAPPASNLSVLVPAPEEAVATIAVADVLEAVEAALQASSTP